MTKRKEDFIIRDNKRLNGTIFILELHTGNPLVPLKPGQFVQIKIEGSHETFLRRPFSVHDVDYESNNIKLLIQVAGSGTEYLSKLRQGDSLNLVYPLGNSFTIPLAEEKVLLVGGGCGIAPLLFLAKSIKSAGCHPDILLGFRDRERIIEYDQYSEYGRVFLTTQDGSEGEKGLVTDHFILKEKEYQRIYCCGPESMMKAIAALGRIKHSECEVSLENLMACGIGVCLCCVVDTVNGNICTCTEGPVFNTNTLKW